MNETNVRRSKISDLIWAAILALGSIALAIGTQCNLNAEVDRYHESVRNYQAAIDEAKAEQEELADRMEKASGRLHGGPFTAAESAAAVHNVERGLERGVPASQYALARTQVLVARTGLSREEIDALAVAIEHLGRTFESLEERPADAREAHLRRQLQRDADAINTVAEREAERRRREDQAVIAALRGDAKPARTP